MMQPFMGGQVDQQVAQFNQSQRPMAPRTTPTPRELALQERMVNNNFMMGMAQNETARRGQDVAVRGQDVQQQTWMNKNATDERIAAQRMQGEQVLQTQQFDFQREMMDEERQVQAEASKRLSQAMERVTQARIEASRKTGEARMQALGEVDRLELEKDRIQEAITRSELSLLGDRKTALSRIRDEANKVSTQIQAVAAMERNFDSISAPVRQALTSRLDAVFRDDEGGWFAEDRVPLNTDGFSLPSVVGGEMDPTQRGGGGILASQAEVEDLVNAVMSTGNRAVAGALGGKADPELNRAMRQLVVAGAFNTEAGSEDNKALTDRIIQGLQSSKVSPYAASAMFSAYKRQVFDLLADPEQSPLGSLLGEIPMFDADGTTLRHIDMMDLTPEQRDVAEDLMPQIRRHNALVSIYNGFDRAGERFPMSLSELERQSKFFQGLMPSFDDEALTDYESPFLDLSSAERLADRSGLELSDDIRSIYDDLGGSYSRYRESAEDLRDRRRGLERSMGATQRGLAQSNMDTETSSMEDVLGLLNAYNPGSVEELMILSNMLGAGR